MEENKTKLELYFNGNFIYKVNKKNVEKVFNIMKESFMDTTMRGNVVRSFYDRDTGKVKHLIERESYVDIEMNMEGMMEYIKEKCIKIERLKDILIYIYIIIIFKKSEGYTYKYLQELYIYLEKRMDCGITLKQIKEYNENDGEYYNVIKIEDGAEYIWKGSGEIDRYEDEECEYEIKNDNEGELKKKIEELEKRLNNIEEKNKKIENNIKNQRTETDFISVILLEKIEELTKINKKTIQENDKTMVTKEEFNKMIIRIIAEMLVIKENLNKIETINETEYDTLSNMSL